MKKKIILILPFFGKLPSYFHLFIKSCLYNIPVENIMLLPKLYFTFKFRGRNFRWFVK